MAIPTRASEQHASETGPLARASEGWLLPHVATVHAPCSTSHSSSSPGVPAKLLSTAHRTTSATRCRHSWLLCQNLRSMATRRSRMPSSGS
eukprot:14419106-Alexandrium_andersonii.AAC.1